MEKRKLNPQKLVPPPEAGQLMKQREAKRPSGNKIVNFIKTFFGEGF